MTRIFNVQYEYRNLFDNKKSSNQLYRDNINVVATDASQAIAKAHKRAARAHSFIDEETNKSVKVTFDLWRPINVNLQAEA